MIKLLIPLIFFFFLLTHLMYDLYIILKEYKRFHDLRRHVRTRQYFINGEICVFLFLK